MGNVPGDGLESKLLSVFISPYLFAILKRSAKEQIIMDDLKESGLLMCFCSCLFLSFFHVFQVIHQCGCFHFLGYLWITWDGPAAQVRAQRARRMNRLKKEVWHRTLLEQH